MSDFIVSLLNLCLVPFQSLDNALVMIPTACLSVGFLFAFIRAFLSGGEIHL